MSCSFPLAWSEPTFFLFFFPQNSVFIGDFTSPEAFGSSFYFVLTMAVECLFAEQGQQWPIVGEKSEMEAEKVSQLRNFRTSQ
jgi:hypothetical protein